LPTIGAALIETPKQSSDCCVIRLNRGLPWRRAARDPRAFAAPKKQQPGRTPTDFRLQASLPQRSDFGTFIARRWTADGGRVQLWWPKRLLVSHLSHHQPM